ncbi:kinetochore protein Nuf2 [Lingula anatina]|uniref:Kinetochore protein Nuf2 n=1 Tax=Lingula anatina TaxID=7574 RepID=A0A1S3KE36_LINAN|nr:kinetochore protein Nuf2 [Lingula anatina]XP_013420895.1 kinetochore protein Nuf2 [Lingula anatina]|eukprot:XP_013420888.1 kinetochore protein Nuf2 [Lingula anatina]
MTARDYMFPVLAVEDIVDYCRITYPDLHLTEGDFKNPQPAKLQRFYLLVLEDTSGINPDQLGQAQFHETDVFEHPTVYEEAVPLLKFTLSMQRLMYACGVQDFKLRDLVEPKPKRTVRLVSALINFSRFQNQRMEEVERLKNENAAVKEQHEQLLRVNDELKTKINHIRASRAEQEPELKKLQGEFEEMSMKIEKHHKDQLALQKTLKEMKEGIAEKKASIDHLKVQMLSAKEEGDRLSRQIVQSPERMKTEGERMRNQLMQLKMTKEERQQRGLELRQQVERLEQIDSHCEQGVKLITGIDAELEREREVLAEVTNIRDRVQSQKDVLRDLTAKEQQLRRMLSTKQEKMAKLNIQLQNKVSAGMETLEQYKQERAHYAALQSEDESQKKAIEQQKQALMEEAANNRKRHEKLMTEMAHEKSQLLEQLDSYHTTLGIKWQEVAQKIQANS